MNDLRYGLRMLIKNPGFTTIAVLSLALGICANTTVFCWIQSVLLRPLPGVVDPQRMVVVTTTHGPAVYHTVSLPNLKDFRGLETVFAGVIGSQITPACMTLSGKPYWAYGQITTANFFEVLGVQPLVGRTFLSGEDQSPGGNTVVVLSERFWRSRFGGDPSMVGQTVVINEQAFTIVGVAPASFCGTMGGLRFDFWAPVSMHRQIANFGSLQERSDHWLHTQARLQPGVSLPQAQAALDALTHQLQQAYPRSNQEIGFRALPLWKSPYGGQALMLPALSVLMAVSVGVLLIVAANVANLLLARAMGRRKEMAIRVSLGAGRFRLIRQLLTESILLALLGGALGVLLANWSVDLFKLFQPKTHLPLGYAFVIDGRALAFTCGLTLLTGIVFGLAPALQASRTDVNDALKEGGRSSGRGAPAWRLRGALVVAEIALALLLLVGAGLCIKGFERARALDVGFDPRNMLLAGLRIGMNGYDQTNGLIFYRRLHERLSLLPGVQGAALASYFPLGFEGGSSLPAEVEGYVRKSNEDVSIPYSIVSPNYFATMRIPLLEGREFQVTDQDQTLRVAIVNDVMAARFWPGQSPLGRRFKIWRGDVTVVGVAKGGKYRSLNEAPTGFFYLPYQQGVWDLNLGVALRTQSDPASQIKVVRDAIHSLDPRVEVWASLTMTDYIQAAFMAQRVTSTLLTALGVIALVLAAMGIYGVMSYVVRQRTHEIGIRMALGARAIDVLRLVVGQGMILGLLGVLLGWGGALALTRLMAGFLYGISPFDPPTFFGTAGLLGGVTFVASFLPARSAARVDPQVALRSE